MTVAPKTALLGVLLIFAASPLSASWYGQNWTLSATADGVTVKGFSEAHYDADRCKDGCRMQLHIRLGSDSDFVALIVDDLLHCGGHRAPPSRRWPSCHVHVKLGDFQATWKSDRISRHIVHLSSARTEPLREKLLGLELPADPVLLVDLDRTVYRFPSLGAVYALREAERLTGATILD